LKPLSFHPEVAGDIKGSYDWYQEQAAGLGESFLNELETALDAINHFPQAWSPFRYGFKRYILARFPFSVIYKEEEKEIFIIAVMHNSREPNYWLDRI